MSRRWPWAWSVAFAAGLISLTGCGPQDGLGAAGEPVAAGESAVGASAGVPRSPGNALNSDELPAGQVPDVNPAGLPCPPPGPQRQLETAALPDLTLACLAPGPDVVLSALPAVPTVLNVWATWCGPCRAEMPLLADFAAAAGDQVTVLGVNVLDDRTAAADFAASVPLASVYDPDGDTRSGLGWAGPPATYFVDAQGRIVHRIYGQIADAETLREAVATHLGVEVPNA